MNPPLRPLLATTALLFTALAFPASAPAGYAAGARSGAQSGAQPDSLIDLPAWDVTRTAHLDSAALNGAAIVGDDVWAVGTSDHTSLVERWNGKQFARVPSPDLSNRNNVLEDVAGSSASDVWAVGHADDLDLGLTSTTLIEHWNGTRWRLVRSPSVPDHLNTLTGVVAIAPDDAWAVGTLTDFQPGAEAILLHWNGDRWSRAKNACGSYLTEIDALSSSEIWATGGSEACHFDGRRWMNIRLDPPNNPQDSLAMRDLTIVSPSDVWAVGLEYSTCGEGQVCIGGAIEHWNGKAWSYITGSVPLLYGVDSAGPANVYAVGLGIGPAIIHNGGSGWELVPNGYEVAELRSVAVGANGSWAVGDRPYQPPEPFAERAPAPNSGAVVGATHVSGATVSWFGKESGSVQTDQFGDYQIGGLRTGRYLLTATYEGCRPGSEKVVIQAGRTIGQDLDIDCS